MTTDAGWTDTPFDQDQQPPPAGMYAHHPVFVHVVATESEQVAPEFASWQTWNVTLAGTGVPIQLCQHRYKRFKAKMIWNIPANTTVWLSNKPDALGTPTPAPTIGQIPGGTAGLTMWTMPDYDGQQPVYAVYTGTGPVTVLVLDESYGTVQ